MCLCELKAVVQIQANILVEIFNISAKLGNESNYFLRVDFSAQHRLSTNNTKGTPNREETRERTIYACHMCGIPFDGGSGGGGGCSRFYNRSEHFRCCIIFMSEIFTVLP